MRTLLLILMVALLPMRMWAAEGMAVRMALDQAATAAGISATAPMPEDCPMMANTKGSTGSQDEAPQAAGHCMACHLCASWASISEVPLEQIQAPTGPSFATARSYASAELARNFRPPIS